MKRLMLLIFVAMTANCLAQTLLIDGTATPTQVPDETAYRQVLVYMQAQTAATLAQKVAAIQFTSSTDVSTFEQIVGQFSIAYASTAAASGNADNLAASYMQLLQQQLSTAGYSQLEAYVQTQKNTIQVYEVSDVNNSSSQTYSVYTSQTALDIGDDDSYWDDYGDLEGSYQIGRATCNFIPLTPGMAAAALHFTGSVTGISATVDGKVPDSSAPPGPNGFPGAGTIITVTYTFPIRIIGTVCNGGIINVSISWQEETAYTFVANLGLPGTSCYEAGGLTICNWAVISACTNTANPDFHPKYITDDAHAAWYTAADCERFVYAGGNHVGPWSCVLGLALGTSNDSPSTHCSYNPQY